MINRIDLSIVCLFDRFWFNLNSFQSHQYVLSLTHSLTFSPTHHHYHHHHNHQQNTTTTFDHFCWLFERRQNKIVFISPNSFHLISLIKSICNLPLCLIFSLLFIYSLFIIFFLSFSTSLIFDYVLIDFCFFFRLESLVLFLFSSLADQINTHTHINKVKQKKMNEKEERKKKHFIKPALKKCHNFTAWMGIRKYYHHKCAGIAVNVNANAI